MADCKRATILIKTRPKCPLDLAPSKYNSRRLLAHPQSTAPRISSVVKYMSVGKVVAFEGMVVLCFSSISYKPVVISERIICLVPKQ